MKYNHVFSGVNLQHELTIRIWLEQTFGKDVFTKSCNDGSNGVRSAYGPWQIFRYYEPYETHARNPLATWTATRLGIGFKKEVDLTLFILKFGHLVV